MRTWADDLRRLCDALGLRKPVVLGSSFGGDVAVTYAALFPDHPGAVILAEESRQFLARMIRNPDVASHYDSHEVSSFDPWSLLGAVRCPVLVLAGEDDPVCPLPVAEELASQLPVETTRLVRLPGARHTVFRDRPGPRFPCSQELCNPDQGTPARYRSSWWLRSTSPCPSRGQMSAVEED